MVAPARAPHRTEYWHSCSIFATVTQMHTTSSNFFISFNPFHSTVGIAESIKLAPWPTHT